jgi:1,4-alpha-glucan branching enzyme
MPRIRGLQKLVKELNQLYQSTPALYEESFTTQGFEWIDHSDNKNCVLAYIRMAKNPDDFVVVVCNFTPQALDGYRIGVPAKGTYAEILNTDANAYFGSGFVNAGDIKTSGKSAHGYAQSIALKLPPLGVSILNFVN